MRIHPGMVSSVVLVLLTSTMACFAAQIPISTTNILTRVSGPLALALGDFDGDGDLDLATGDGSASNTSGEFIWAINDPAFSFFFPFQICSACDDTTSVDTGDINGDGHVDILVTFDDDNLVYVMLNSGTAIPTWSQNLITFAFPRATGVTSGDMDGDGDLDVVAVALGFGLPSEISWFENDGASTPSWTEHNINSNLSSGSDVELADLNCDGLLDIVTMELGLSRVVAYMQQTGSVTFTTNLVVTNVTGLSGFNIGDIDQDGDPDVVTAWKTGHIVAWSENDGSNSPSFFTRNVGTGITGAHDVVVTDMDLDGDPDIVASAQNSGEIRWYESDGSPVPSFTSHVLIVTNSPSEIVVADIDNDGDPDIIGASRGPAIEDDIFAIINESIHRSALYSRETALSTNEFSASHAIAVDVDKDGDLDVVSAGPTGQKVTWFVNDGTNNIASTTNTITLQANNVRRIAVGDLDGDGDQDIVAAAAVDDKIEWYEQTNGVFTTNLIRSGVDGANDVMLVDLDRDGDLDIVSSAENLDEVVWYDNDGAADPSFTTQHISTNENFVQSVYATDLDEDGDIDVVAAVNLENEIVWFEADTNRPPLFTTNVAASGIGGPRHVSVADVDGDGDKDILVAAATDNEILWLESDGSASPSFSENSITSVAMGARYVSAADVDADGDMDILAASATDNKIAWHESDGEDNPSFTERIITTNASSARSVVVADLDADGHPDLLVSSSGDDRVAWYMNGGGQFALPTTNKAPYVLFNGETTEVFSIALSHRGREGDSEMYVEELELFLGRENSVALTAGQANSLISNLTVYIDDGSGVLEPGSDLVVTNLQLFAPSIGTQTISIVEGATNVTSSVETSALIFVSVELATNAHEQTFNALMVRHITEDSSTAKDGTADTLLDMEFVTNETAVIFVITETSDFDGDGMPDIWEFDEFGHPTNETAEGDVDGDSMGNLDEYISDTDPEDSNSLHYVTGVTNITPTNATVYFNSSTGRLYTLQSSGDLRITNGWTNVTGQIDAAGAGGADAMSEANAGLSNRSFRVKVRLP